jgi:hypothetical protein
MFHRAGVHLQRAADLFVARFAQPEDYFVTPPGTGWIPVAAAKHPPEIEYFATFCRGEDGAEAELVALDPTGWTNNIGNVRELALVLTRKVPDRGSSDKTDSEKLV